MADYADYVDDVAIKDELLVKIRPRRNPTAWTLVTGSVYSTPFSFGLVYLVEDDGVALTEGTSTTLSAGQWFYDNEADLLYVRLSDSSNPSSSFMVVTYELFLGTLSKIWHRDPTDDTTDMVLWRGYVNQAPSFRSNTDEITLGIQPRETSSIVLVEGTGFLQEHLYESSFNGAQILVYRWLKRLLINNVKLILDGRCGNVVFDKNVRITVYDRVDQLDDEIRNPDGASSFFGRTDFPDLDPNFFAQPIPYFYGKVEGLLPVNVDYEDETLSNTVNRTFCVYGEDNNLAEVTKSVPAGAHTATKTFLTSAQGLTIGDSVWFDRVVGTDEYLLLTNVDYGANFVEHAALSGGAMASGDSLRASFVRNVSIVHNDVTYTALYGRDYTSELALPGGTSGFSFTTTAETNLSFPGGEYISPFDVIYCTVFGRKNDVLLNGSPFGTNDSETGNLTHPVVILKDLFDNLGIAESEIDLTSFSDAFAAVNSALGFVIPQNQSDSWPSYKDQILGILGSVLGRLVIDNDNKWKLTILEPISTTYDETVRPQHILEDGFSYAFDYQDLASEVKVHFNRRQHNDEMDKVSAESTTARLLHGVDKQKSFDSLFFREADAQALADKLICIFGDRKGTLSLELNRTFFESLIADRVRVLRDRIPGFEYIRKTLRTRIFRVSGIDKTNKRVQLTLDDQKGIEDNPGEF